MRRLRSSAFTAMAITAIVAAPIGAQEKHADSLLTVEKYLDFEQVGEPRVSPDGSQVIYTRRWVNKLEDKFESAMWIMNIDGSKNRFLGTGGGAIWSPDGTRIAFLNEGKPSGTQIFVRWMDAEGATSQVTTLAEGPSDIRWSPDGKWIGFSSVVPKSVNWKIDMPEAPKGAKWTATPRVVQSLHFRQDRRGYTDAGFRHLFLVPADGGTPRQVTKGDFNFGARFDGLDGAVGWDWLPDGKSIIADGLADSTSDMNYRNSNLYAIDVNTGAMRRLNSADGAWSTPVVSPDGRRVAYSGYTQVKDSYHTAELYVMNTDGSATKKITGDLDRDVGDVTWATDGSGIYFTIADSGTSNVYFSPNAGGARPVTMGTHAISAFSMSKSGKATAIRSSYLVPADIVRLSLPRVGAAEITQLTHVNDDVLARIKLGDVERVRYTSTGGTTVDGWVVKPPHFDASKKYPLIMEIHGGPHGAYGVGFNYQFQNFAANDYVVLYTNPRGSTGYGSAFGNAIMHAYPSVDYDDLMAGVNAVVNKGYVDTTRMYVGGCSGGGVLSSWVIGHTNRFAGAAVRCPVIDWLSFAGQTDIPFFTYNFFDAPFWEKPEQWLKQSPIMYVGNVTTPTVVMTGVLDMRTPMPQSEEFYEALKMRGVPAALIRFEGEFHGTGSKPSNFMRTQLYMMSWYNRWRRTGTSVTTVME